MYKKVSNNKKNFIYVNTLETTINTIITKNNNFFFSQYKKIIKEKKSYGRNQVSLIEINNNLYILKKFYPCWNRSIFNHKSRATKSFLKYKKYEKLGIKTPKPLIIINEKKKQHKNISYILFEYIKEIPIDDKKKKMILVSKAISDMHNKNIIHNDLNWSNIIPIKNKNNDIEIYIIDINRSKFKRKGISINNRLKDLQRLNLNGSNKKFFFETYCIKTGCDYNILTKKY